MSDPRNEIAFLISESEARPPVVWVINVGKSPPSGQMASPCTGKDSRTGGETNKKFIEKGQKRRKRREGGKCVIVTYFHLDFYGCCVFFVCEKAKLS